MTRFVGLSGSLRRDSWNTALLRAAQTLLPEGVELAIHSIAAVPLYNFDDEASTGLPEPVLALKTAIAASDGLLLASPEYNNGVPGVLKNTVDWLSRTPRDTRPVFRDLPVALAGASPGSFGTLLAQNAWLPVFRSLSARLWVERLLLPGASKAFDAQRNLTDEQARQRLEKFLRGFTDFATG